MKTLTTTLMAAILGAGMLQAESNKSLCPASEITGKEVSDPQGNSLGHISQLLIDPNSGRVRYAVIEVDKTWNWSDAEVAVPFQSLQVKTMGNGNDTKLTLDATKEKLEKAPKFKDEDATRLYSKEASQPVYSYWAVTWYDDVDAGNPSTRSSTRSSSTTSPSPTMSPAASPSP